MRKFGKIRLACIAALGLIIGGALGVSPANAGPSLSFDLTSDHCSGTGGCLAGGSAGTIVVTDLGGGTLQYQVELKSGFGIINTGGSGGLGASLGFNLDLSPILISNLTSGFSVVGGLNPASSGSIHVDGFGNFDYGVNCDTCGTGSTNPFFGTLTFDATAAGLTLADITQSTGGSPNAFFAVDLFSTLTGNTGPVDASVATTVPEPASIAIFGVGLTALGIIMRRRRASSAEA